MQCPRCHLENPPTTDVCDCGYSFATGSYARKALGASAALGGAGLEKTRYAALEGISTICRIAAWLVAGALVLAGIVILVNSTDQLKYSAIPPALGCFIGAAFQWLLLKAFAEVIMLFVDVAYDVRAIAIKINNVDGR